MGLHPLLQTVYLFRRTGQRAADVDHIQHLKGAFRQIHEVLMITAQRRGAHIVAAYVKDHAVPIQNESGLHLGREGKRFNAGAGKVGGDQADLLLLHHLSAFRQPEIGVYHIQIDQLRALAAGSGLHGKVQRKLTFTAAVVTDQYFDFFHPLWSPL